MRIVPAVDIRGGLCVNLVQGDYGQETVFSDDPVAQAVQWRDLGADLVHVVDLDGARDGQVRVAAQLRALSAAGVAVEVGGGIRNMG
ncbi:MAG: 1-(5-phosphoribosyl)-5-((5-phosphoribosylamino)methylideneamino)imidazole-4-carboxamide isomerase, partial [Candidatus Hydrogenedentes bacterium]|nr:1-(5-phosphoribosyl)-5-((5-phosphoribosylamino)methylideneamino)imidazole-4-carboxamide isomerase [Candidatus Hydrogenedentota bacterium]